MTLRWTLVVCLLGGLFVHSFGRVLEADQGRSQSPQSTPSISTANKAFGNLDFELSLEWKPTKAEWDEILRNAGIKPTPNDPVMWNRLFPDGDLRVHAYLKDDNLTTVFLMFFPASKPALSDATLNWLYRTSNRFGFVSVDGIELGFPAESITKGAGTKRRIIQVSMTTNAIQRTGWIYEWK